MVEQMLFGVVEVVDKLLEQMDVKHYLMFLFDIVEQKVEVVVQDLTEMVELVVAVAVVVMIVAVVERLDDDDKVDFENMDDDGYYYCQQLIVVVLLVVPV
jgi:isoprenylcysteine carboxyl methyltransferase (ICMT) family protein YpbQ